MENITQIFISENNEKLPNFFNKASTAIKKQFFDSKYTIYNDGEIKNFLTKHFNEEVLWAYNSLQPYAYKACLARYCILYIKGGWYFDLGIRCLHAYYPDLTVDFICFRDDKRHAKNSWSVCDGIFWTKKNSDILNIAIKKVIQNCKEKWYGRTPLCPAGPSLFGEAIVEGNRGKKIIFGDLIRPKVPFTRKDIPILLNLFKATFYLPNDKPIALLKPAPGGNLKSLGMKGSNNYNDFWKQRNIYK